MPPIPGPVGATVVVEVFVNTRSPVSAVSVPPPTTRVTAVEMGPPSTETNAPVVGSMVTSGEQLKLPLESLTCTQFRPPRYGCQAFGGYGACAEAFCACASSGNGGTSGIQSSAITTSRARRMRLIPSPPFRRWLAVERTDAVLRCMLGISALLAVVVHQQGMDARRRIRYVE